MSPTLPRVERAVAQLARARAELQEAIEEVRAEGASWADVGLSLGISRQAAFKRFGRPRDPRNGADMTRRSLHHVTRLTEQVVRHLDSGDYAAVRALMEDSVAAELTEQRVLGTWARVVGEIGNVEGFRDTAVELPDRTRLDSDDQVIGLVVGDSVVQCEAGEVRARVALDDRDRIVGLLLVPTDATELPF